MQNLGNHNCGNNGNLNTAIYCTYCHKTGYVKKNCFKLKKKENQNYNSHESKHNSNRDRQNFDSTDGCTTTTRRRGLLELVAEETCQLSDS
jgi:hypothetical protein